MRHAWIVAASLLAGALVAAPAARADDPPPRRAPPSSEGGKNTPDGKGDEAKKDDATLRIERAKQIVKALEDAVARVKAAPTIDAVMLQTLMVALEQAKALTKPAKPEELTAEEKKAVVEAAKPQPGAADAPKDGADSWQERAVVKALEGADLNEEETAKAKSIIGEWYKESMGSFGDSKKTSDLKRKRDDDLEKALGKKKSQKVINNLNAMGPGRR